MRFAALPTEFAVLLLAGVVAAVVLLYLLKPSPRRIPVSSTLIWRRVLRSRRRAPDRLRWWLSLLLAMLVALCVALALTRPRLGSSSTALHGLVLVLDNSVTLSARTSDGRTRWDHAVERARGLIRTGPAGARYLIADTQRQIGSPHFEEVDPALATLERLRVTLGGEPVFPQVVPRGDPDLRAVLITDGVARLEVPGGVESLPVFQVADNAGLTAFDVRAMPADPVRQQAYVEVFNASPGPREVEVSVTGAGHPPLTHRLRLAAGASAGELFDVSTFDAGPLRAAVSMAGDALSADDVAFSFAPGHRVRRVVLVTSGNSTLERSLRLLRRVQLTVVAPGRYADRAGVDAWVFDRYAPPQPPAAPSLLFRPSRVDWLPAAHSDTGETSVSAWVRGHPLTEGLSLQDVIVSNGRVVRDDSRFEVICADAQRRPLILASLHGPRRVDATFALEDSNLPQQAGFPVFLSNALEWLAGESRSVQARVGLIEVPVPAAKVLDLRGHTVPTRRLPGATLIDAWEPGFFTATAPDGRVRVAVSVLDPVATNINASRFAETPAAPALVSEPRWRVEVWTVLLLAAALLLVLEWWTFNRRLTV